MIVLEREKKFIKNTIIIAIGKICTQLITFLLLPLYTGILTAEEYGIIDLLNALIQLLLPILTMQVEQGMLRELLDSRNNEKKQKQTISNTFYYIILQCVIYLFIFIIISPFVNNRYKIFLIINLIVAVFSGLCLQITRGLGDNKKYSIGSFLCAISIVCFNIFFLVILKIGVTGMLLGTFLGHILCIVYLFFSLKIHKYISYKLIDKRVIKELLKYSLPLVPNSLSWWVFNASDKIIVSSILGLSATGILSIANKFPSLITTAYNIFHLSFFENILLHSKDDDIDEYYNKIFNAIIGIFLAISVGIIACLPYAFPIMINNKFNDAYNLIPIIILANIFHILVSSTGVIYSANRNTKAIANTSIISAIINIVIHIITIKFLGLYAAVISTFVSYLIMALYRLYTVNKEYFKIKINKSILILSSIVLPIILTSYYINNKYLNFISILIAIMYAFITNRNSIVTIFNIVKQKKI